VERTPGTRRRWGMSVGMDCTSHALHEAAAADAAGSTATARMGRRSRRQRRSRGAMAPRVAGRRVRGVDCGLQRWREISEGVEEVILPSFYTCSFGVFLSQRTFFLFSLRYVEACLNLKNAHLVSSAKIYTPSNPYYL
jgi:hypothetical protein